MRADPRLVSLLVDACRGTLGGPDIDDLYTAMRETPVAVRAAMQELPAALRRDDCVCGESHYGEEE